MIKALTKTFQTDNGINYLNMGLMVLSAAIAFYLPFHLFLFAYAVLGPLHYLTEISWLEKRSFFIPNKWDIVIYVIISVIIFLSFFDKFKRLGSFNTALMITAFITAIMSIFIKNNVLRFVLIISMFIVMVGLKVRGTVTDPENTADQVRLFLLLLFSVLLPTLIHVFLFTGLFIFYGALKAKSRTGIISLLVFISCSVFFFVFVPAANSPISNQVKFLFQDFKAMNHAFLYFFHVGEFQTMNDILYPHDATLFTHPMAIAVMRFIAFAYCYHYLNWFSKTSVIKWHEVSKQRLFTIILLWVLSVVIYAMNYQTGFKVLFILSMLHVFCEFPLNIQTIKGIGFELGKLGGKSAKPVNRKKK